MVDKLTRGDRTYYVCGVCGFAYLEEKWARECERFCTENKACSLEITQHAVELPKEEANDRTG